MEWAAHTPARNLRARKRRFDMKRVSRRGFMQGGAALATAGFVGRGALAKEASLQEDKRPPNILWITMEDTSPQFIGCYGNKSARTPNMDRMASEGVRFTRAFSTAPVCAPSRCSIITGCLPEVLGTGNHRSYYPIPDFVKGFPYYLRQAGYFTSNNLKTDYNVGDIPGMVSEVWDECFGAGGWGTNFRFNNDTFDENSREAGWWHRKPGQPFFSVFNLFNSHESRTLTLPHDWYEEYVLKYLPPEDHITPDEVTVPPFYRDTPEMRKHVARVYNSLRLTDREFGKILERLESDGLKDDTIVFWFADHGEAVPRGKTSAIGLGFQVPFSVYFPPKYQHLSPWPIGKPTDELVSSSEDVAPTILSLAGVDIPEYMHGRPLMGKARRSPRPFVWGGRNRIDESPELTRAVSDGRFFYARVFMPQFPLVKFTKYMEVGDIMRTIRADYQAGRLNELQASLVKPEQPNEYLFDLENDPWQTQNLAESFTHREMLVGFRGALHKHLHEIRDVNFMPEYELAMRSENGIPYHFRLDENIYPFERIMTAANMVGDRSAIPHQLKTLKDKNGIVRYWAAIGLDAQGSAVKPFEKEIMEALKDPYPPAQIALAGIAYKVFESQQARQILEKHAESSSPSSRVVVLQTMQTIEYMREKALPFASTLKKVLNLTPKRHKGYSGVAPLAETNS